MTIRLKTKDTNNEYEYDTKPEAEVRKKDTNWEMSISLWLTLHIMLDGINNEQTTKNNEYLLIRLKTWYQYDYEYELWIWASVCAWE